MAGGADAPPTDAALAWLTELEKDLSAAKDAYKSLVETDVAAFNQSMEGKLPAITETLRAVQP